MYQVSRSTVTSPPGAGKGVLSTKQVARLTVQPNEQDCSKAAMGTGAAGVPVLNYQAMSPPAPGVSRWGIQREGEHLCGKADPSFATDRGI